MSEYRIAEQNYPEQLKTIWDTSLQILKNPIHAASNLSVLRPYSWPHYVLIVALNIVLTSLVALVSPSLQVGVVYLVLAAAASVALQLYIGPWVLQKVIGLFGRDWSFEDARYYSMLFQGASLLILLLVLIAGLLGGGIAMLLSFAIFGFSILYLVQGLRFGVHYTGLGYGKLILLILVYALVVAVPGMILQSLLGVPVVPA
jgi:hypothetical protein